MAGVARKGCLIRGPGRVTGRAYCACCGASGNLWVWISVGNTEAKLACDACRPALERPTPVVQ